MSLADLTHQSVEAALVEAASIGRDEFLKRYGFGPARRYFVEWNGARYDSKAIAGAAHGHLQGKSPLAADDFSGGEATVARRLRELGFEVPEGGERNPGWTRDELILALDLYVRFKGNPPGKGSAEIIGLSAILNRLSRSTAAGRPGFPQPQWRVHEADELPALRPRLSSARKVWARERQHAGGSRLGRFRL